MKLYTQFTHEKIWVQTREVDALRLLEEAFPQVPPAETLAYIKAQCAHGKIVRIADMKFKAEV